MAEIAIFEHFKPKLEVFRPKMDPIQVLCAEKAFPHGFRTVIARLGCLLAIFIILIGIDDRKKEMYRSGFEPGTLAWQARTLPLCHWYNRYMWCFFNIQI